MKRNTLKAILVVVVLAVLSTGLLAWAFERKGVVHSEPMACFTSGAKVVCFDGEPAGNLICEEADAHTVICLSAE